MDARGSQERRGQRFVEMEARQEELLIENGIAQKAFGLLNMSRATLEKYRIREDIPPVVASVRNELNGLPRRVLLLIYNAPVVKLTLKVTVGYETPNGNVIEPGFDVDEFNLIKDMADEREEYQVGIELPETPPNPPAAA